MKRQVSRRIRAFRGLMLMLGILIFVGGAMVSRVGASASEAGIPSDPTTTSPSAPTSTEEEWFTYDTIYDEWGHAVGGGTGITGLTDAGKQRYTNSEDLLEIPTKTSDGISIIGIGDRAFENLGLEGKLVIPSNIKILGFAAFKGNKLTEVKFTDGLTFIGREVFMDNQISKANYKDILNVRGWSYRSNHNNYLDKRTGVLSADMFNGNQFTEIDLTGMGGVASGAFANNQIGTLYIPKNISNIFPNAFQGNKQLTSLTFEAEGGPQIDRYGFEGCSLTEVKFPQNMGEMGGYSFANNNLSHVEFPKNKDVLVGYAAFLNNPYLETVTMPKFVKSGRTGNLRTAENAAFATGALKNVYYLDNSHEAISKQMFFKNKLKAIEIPNSISLISDLLIIHGYNDSSKRDPFEGNPGWYNDKGKVALYRIKDINTPSYAYDMDNQLPDGAAYTINPVLVDFEFYYSDGKTPLVDENIPSAITVNRVRAGQTDSTKIEKVKGSWLDWENFKLGDKLTFELPEGFSVSGETVTLDPTLPSMMTVDYSDGYTVGYKKQVIRIHSGKDAPKVEAPVTLEIQFLKKDGVTALSADKIPSELSVKRRRGVEEDSIKFSKGSWIDSNNFLMNDQLEVEVPKDFEILGTKSGIVKISLDDSNSGITVGSDGGKRFILSVISTLDETGSEVIVPKDDDPTPVPENNPAQPQTIPSFDSINIPDPSSPDSPETIMVVDEDGTPRVYTKQTTEDGEEVYVDEDGTPLSNTKPIPKTSDIYPVGLMTVVVLSLAGAVILTNKKRTEE